MDPVAKYNALAQARYATPPQDWTQAFAHLAPKEEEKTKGRGGFFSSLISELAGAGGAAGGAALGTAILPGAGTLLGAILGGFAGGTGGRVVENKVRDDRIGIGDALKEGLLSGALSGAGEGIQLFKGAKAAGVGLKEALKGGAAIDKGVIQGVGQGLERGAGGYGIGSKVAGKQALTATGSDEVASTLKALKIGAGSPERQVTSLGKRLESLGTELSDTYSKNAVGFTTNQADDLGKKILDKVTTRAGLDETAKNYALDQVTNLVKNHSMDTSSLWKFTKDLEADAINFAANPDATTGGRQVVSKIISGDVRDLLNKTIPGLAEKNKLYSKAINAQDYLLKASADRTGGGLFGKLTSLSPVKAAESKAGSALSRVGRYTAGTGGFGTQVTNNAIRQAPANLTDAIIGASAKQMTPEDQPVDTAIQGISGMSPLGQVGTLAPGQSGGTDELSQLNQQIDAAIRQDLATTGGKNINNLLAYQDFYSKNIAPPTGGGAPNVTKVTAQQYGLAQRGQSALQQLYDKISSDPGVINKLAIPGRGLPGIGGFISNAAGTGEYDAIGYQVADSILRLSTGAQANEGEIKNLQTKLMPRAGDNAQTIKTKIQNISNYFSSILSTAGSGSTQGSTLEDALMQAQGGF